MKKMTRLFGCLLALILALLPAAGLAEAVEDSETVARPTITAYKASAVVIDGNLDEWNLGSPAVVDQLEQVIRDANLWAGPMDVSAKFYLAWDETNLYMAADVNEDSPLGAIEMLPVDGEDNLKLYISTNPDADPNRTAYETNDFLVYFIMYEGYWDTAVDRSMLDKEQLQRYTSKGMNGGESALDGYECAVQMTTTGFIWEAIIPWAAFSNAKIPVYVPQAGDTLSVNFAITDISYPCPGTEYIPQMAWTGSQAIWLNPSLWGAVTLAE